jgi:hypothetical protein
MTTHLLKGWWGWLIVAQCLESNSEHRHLFPNGILPKRVAIFFVNPNTILVSLRNFGSKLMSSLVGDLCIV